MRDPSGISQRTASITLMLILSVFSGALIACFSPPEGAREAIQALDPESTTNPQGRIIAINRLLSIAVKNPTFSGWQQIQEKGFQDPDERVRAASVLAIKEFALRRPEEVVKKGLITTTGYIDMRTLEKLGTSDPSPTVRIAVAELLGSIAMTGDEGMTTLTRVLDVERDLKVSRAIRHQLSKRLSQDISSGIITGAEAADIRRRYSLTSNND